MPRTEPKVVLKPGYPGSTEIAVYRPSELNPHFIISGSPVEDLDTEKIIAYMYGCDWCDRDSTGWITPFLRCDGFLKANNTSYIPIPGLKPGV
jgi:hypothetical protein